MLTHRIAGVDVNVVLQMLEHSLQISSASGTQEGSVSIALKSAETNFQLVECL